MKPYKTIKNNITAEHITKKSRFLSHIKRVTTREEATDFINEIRAKYHDATHNVYAYCLRTDNIMKYSDDGEPQGTSGMPTLDVLLKNELVDTCIVTTRYYGGILLGAGGLVRAYSTGASLAVKESGIVLMTPCVILNVKCDYSFYGKLGNMVSGLAGEIVDTIFEDEVSIFIKFRVEREKEFAKKLTEISAGTLSYTKTEEKYMEITI